MSQFTPFVQIKEGTEPPPIFIAHGLSGTVQVGKLAKEIQTEHPIYGVQAKGIDGMEEPFDRLEDMATFYLEKLEELCPHGPYILIGYSFGGLVALEIAQRMLDKGENVAQLILLDAYPHPRYLSRRQRVRLLVRRVRSHLGNMRQMPFSEALSFALRAMKRRMRMGGPVIDSEGHLETPNSPFNKGDLLRVKQKAFVAYANYRPRFYRGRITFVTTEIKSFFPDDPASVWGKLAEGIQVEVIPGDHLNIVTTHFETLASVLTRVLNSEAAAGVDRAAAVKR
jgi:acetoacetyl-CoA synthetase